MNGEKNELRFMNGVCEGVKNIKIHRTSRAHKFVLRLKHNIILTIITLKSVRFKININNINILP